MRSKHGLGVGALLAFALVGAAEATPSGERLKTLAAGWGIPFGVAVTRNGINAGGAYTQTLNEEFNLITPENEMKMSWLRPSSETTWQWTDADLIADYAVTHGHDLHGHVLAWHKVPGWVNDVEIEEPERLEALLQNHVETVVARYASNPRLKLWDVVNEAYNMAGQLRVNDTVVWGQSEAGSVWGRHVDDYIAKAFTWARGQDADAVLLYNDFGIEEINAKSDAVYAMAQELLSRNVPIGGIGFQCHFRMDASGDIGLDVQSFQDNLRRFNRLGLKVYITELDVRDPHGNPTAQAANYKKVIDAALFDSALGAIQTWGFTNAHVGWSPPEDALYFDTSYVARPAYYAMQSRLAYGAFGSSRYKLTAAHSGKVLHTRDDGSNGDAIAQFTFNSGWASQRWQLLYVPGTKYHLLKSQHGGRFAKIVNGSTADDAPLEVYDNIGTASQRWFIEYTGGGRYALKNANSGKVASVRNASLTDTAVVSQMPYIGSAAQQWTITWLED